MQEMSYASIIDVPETNNKGEEMEANHKILTDAIEYLQDATTQEPDKLQKTVTTALIAIQGELEDIKQQLGTRDKGVSDEKA